MQDCIAAGSARREGPHRGRRRLAGRVASRLPSSEGPGVGLPKWYSLHGDHCIAVISLTLVLTFPSILIHVSARLGYALIHSAVIPVSIAACR